MELEQALFANNFSYGGGRVEKRDFLFTCLPLQGSVEVKPLTASRVSVNIYSQVAEKSVTVAMGWKYITDKPMDFVLHLVVPTILMLERSIG